jgi:hypothetical protein
MAEREFFNAKNFKKLLECCEKKSGDNATSADSGDQSEHVRQIAALQKQIDDLLKTVNEHKTEINRLKGKRN